MKRALKLISAMIFIFPVFETAAFAQGQIDGKTMRFRQDTPAREGRRVGILYLDWFYCHPKSGEVYRVPSTYITDYASVPWFSELTGFDQFGAHKEAALIHDWLYSVGEPDRRKHADNVFLFELKNAGLSFSKRRAMYRAVRLGGNDAYGRADEWERRFIDLDAGVLTEPPFSKPAKAAIDNIPNCAGFEDRLDALRIQYGTDSEAERLRRELESRAQSGLSHIRGANRAEGYIYVYTGPAGSPR